MKIFLFVQFIRCDIETPEAKLYNLIHEDCKKKPGLIISIYGGAKYFKINERLEKEFMRGVIEAAATAGNISFLYKSVRTPEDILGMIDN